ncbi:hypothetical protein H0H81_009236, partial [Sphagnurus paluster]
WLDFSRASEAQLKILADACDPATFGLGQSDVLDESYRKAGKMDLENFSMKFDITESRVIDYVREQLLDGADQNKQIRAELYKMNVYGDILFDTPFIKTRADSISAKGSFFKSHKDTPRGDTMFASLVVVFPTAHEGGALLLRHAGKEWIFDSATIIREQAEPSIVYIAFYSDVDHEVSLVTSGYRFTVTYNLFFESDDTSDIPLSVAPVAPDDFALRTSLLSALANASFLPEGGYLGFGLSFKYPVSQKDDVFPETTVLKGSDAAIHRVCTQLSLETSLNAVYQVTTEVQMLVSVNSLLNYTYINQSSIIDILFNHYDGRIIHEFGKKAPRHPYSERRYTDTIRLLWVTPSTNYSHFGSSFLAYFGNEPGMDCIYGDLCLAVKVGPPGSRETVGKSGS